MDTKEVIMNKAVDITNYKLPDGSVYTGECIQHFNFVELKGKGEIHYPNGDSFTGDFDGGFVRGFGKYHFRDGDSHIGYFYDGIPEGIGYLNHHSSMCLGYFHEGKLNGWGIQINSRGLFNFGWWENNLLIQNETSNIQWIRSQINEQMNLYKGTLIHIFNKQETILFGIPQVTRKSILDNTIFTQPPMGFLFLNTGEVIIGDKIYSQINGWLIRYTPNRKIVYGYWKNGILEKEGSLSNFQSSENEPELSFF